MIKTQNFFRRNTGWGLTWLIVVLLGGYFRLYPLVGFHSMSPEAAEKIAQSLIQKRLETQFANQILQQTPDIQNSSLQRKVQDQLQTVTRNDAAQYRSAIEEMRNEILEKSKAGRTRNYLLEADPYYYFHLTKNILKTGRLGEKSKDGQFYDPFRVFPKGTWSPVTWHPYLGALWLKVFKAAGSLSSEMEILGYFPVVLFVIVMAAFFLLGRVLKCGVFPVFVGSLALALSPIFIQRSAYGWYDTDPYNYFFPAVLLTCLFAGITSLRFSRWLAAAGGLLTAVYALFWVGWPLFFGLMLGGIVAAFLIQFLWGDAKLYPGSKRFALFYPIFAFLFLIALLTPGTFIRMISDGLLYLPSFMGEKTNLWPNIFITVGETRSTDLVKLIFLTGNPVTFALMILSVAAPAVFFRWHRDRKLFFDWLLMTILTGPLVFLAFRAERFAIFVVLPFSLMLALGAKILSQWGRSLDLKQFLRLPSQKFWRRGFQGMLLLIFLPLQFIFAHGVSLGMQPIMDDAWHDMLLKIRQQTPANAVIYSWWPPGHFLTAIAERRVVSDGGSQHLPETYWLARFFMSQDESEALEILQMLHSGGNAAVDYLLEKGRTLPQAIDEINKILAGEDAVLDPALLDRIQSSEDIFPSYVMVYDELVEKTLALSVLSYWDFQKAMAEQSVKKGNFVESFLSTTQGFLRYTPLSALKKREEDIFYFQNGLKVDRISKQAVWTDPKTGKDLKLASFLILENGQLQETPGLFPELNASALFIEEDGQWGAVMADRKLLRSMLFRLYYLRGRSLSHFQLTEETNLATTPTRLLLFKVDWPERSRSS